MIAYQATYAFLLFSCFAVLCGVSSSNDCRSYCCCCCCCCCCCKQAVWFERAKTATHAFMSCSVITLINQNEKICTVVSLYLNKNNNKPTAYPHATTLFCLWLQKPRNKWIKCFPPSLQDSLTLSKVKPSGTEIEETTLCKPPTTKHKL